MKNPSTSDIFTVFGGLTTYHYDLIQKVYSSHRFWLNMPLISKQEFLESCDHHISELHRVYQHFFLEHAKDAISSDFHNLLTHMNTQHNHGAQINKESQLEADKLRKDRWTQNSKTISAVHLQAPQQYQAEFEKLPREREMHHSKSMFPIHSRAQESYQKEFERLDKEQDMSKNTILQIQNQALQPYQREFERLSREREMHRSKSMFPIHSRAQESYQEEFERLSREREMHGSKSIMTVAPQAQQECQTQPERYSRKREIQTDSLMIAGHSQKDYTIDPESPCRKRALENQKEPFLIFSRQNIARSSTSKTNDITNHIDQYQQLIDFRKGWKNK